jgi:hypothetical protein
MTYPISQSGLIGAEDPQLALSDSAQRHVSRLQSCALAFLRKRLQTG